MARKGDGIWRRGKAWWLEFRHQGKRYQMSLGLNISRTVAAEIAVKKRGAILSGEAGIGVKLRDLLFEKAAEEFLKAAKANTRPNTYRSYDQHIRIMTDHFRGKRLGNISAFLVEKYKQKRIAAGVTVGFNRELGTLRTLFNWCIEKGKYEGANPTLRIKRLKESRGRERFLELEEEERLLGACSETLRVMLMCGIYAGLRIPSEVLHLKWQDIDLKRGLLTVQGVFAKNGQTETLPLNSKLAAALQHLKKSCRSE